jgi:putative ABC transport system permease protein
MNLFQLVLKQMRQRALGSWLTILSVLLGVALATAVLLIRRESEQVFGQNDYGYDVLVGPRGSPLQLTINTVYHIDKSPGNIPYTVYEGLGNPRHPQVKIAVPYAVGDSYKGRRIIGTLPKLFGFDEQGKPLPPERVIEYRPGRKYELAQGRVFHPEKFEAVIGADVQRLTGLKLGGKFKATHGLPAPGQQEDVHDQEWEVVGVLEPTHTANDEVLFIPLTSFYAISEHEEGLKAHEALRQAAGGRPPAPAPAPTPPAAAPKAGPDADHDHDDHGKETSGEKEPPGGHDDHDHKGAFDLNPDGTIHLHVPKNEWELSAVLVKSRGGIAPQTLMYMLNNSPMPVMGVNPASVMREFFNTFLRGSSLLLLAVAALVTLVAAVSILVSIYNSVSARLKEIAILRALGATRRRVLALICLEAGFIGLFGGVLGIVVGHLAAGLGSVYFNKTLGESINWVTPDRWEGVYLLGAVVIAVLAGLVPALKAYRTPVATNLVAG